MVIVVLSRTTSGTEGLIGGQQGHMAKSRTRHGARTVHVPVRLAHRHGRRSRDLAAIPGGVVHAGQPAVDPPTRRRNSTSAHSNWPAPRPLDGELAEFAHDDATVSTSLERSTPPPADRPRPAWRRRRAAARHAARERSASASLSLGDGRRPRTVDPPRLDRLDDKSVTASPQRHRALPPQPVGIDDGSRACSGRLPQRHDQRRALAIVRQRLGPQRQRDEAAAGALASRSRCRRMRRLP